MTEKQPQPLFYEAPTPILKDRHLKAGIKTQDNFLFAKDAKTLPLSFPEFAEAAKQYPIVFTSSDNPIPIAIMGLEENNLYVDEKGNWDEDLYIPAYARRYPFAFTMGPDEKQLLLCVDESSDRYVAKAGSKDVAFFDDKGDQSEALKNVLKFCEQYQGDSERALVFSKKLNDMGLLKERRITINLGEGVAPAELHGFRTIDEDAFRALDAKTLEEWHKQGALAALNYQIMSGSNWGNLVAKQQKLKKNK